jgi:hypothetical protein
VLLVPVQASVQVWLAMMLVWVSLPERALAPLQLPLAGRIGHWWRSKRQFWIVMLGESRA